MLSLHEVMRRRAQGRASTWRSSAWVRPLASATHAALDWALRDGHPWRLRAVIFVTTGACAAVDTFLLTHGLSWFVGLLRHNSGPHWKNEEIALLGAAIWWLIWRATAMVRGNELEPRRGTTGARPGR